MNLFSSQRAFHVLTALFAVLLGSATVLQAQSIGDTISVKAFDFQSVTRDTTIQFPDLQGVTYEKVMLKYTMRCKEGLVSTVNDRNLGCGEWDFSCNTYLVDSSKIEESVQTIADNFITNFDEDFFDFRNDPVYDFLRTNLQNVEVLSSSNEVAATVGSEVLPLDIGFPTEQVAGKSYFLYTAAELNSAGLSAGEIDAIGIPVVAFAGEAQNLRVKMKETTQIALDGGVDMDGFQEVFANNTSFSLDQINRLHFHTPFMWDGSSSILIEFNFSNFGTTSGGTRIETTSGDIAKGLVTTDEQQLLLTNNSYIEIDGYKGIGGDQNRTIEAWVKTSTVGTNGEIAAWGLNAGSVKSTFRLSNGFLRFENGAGGTVGATQVNDGEWHHVAVVLDGDNLTDINFYIDGHLDGRSAVGNTDINTEAGPDGFNVRISRGINNRYLNAEIDDIRIWDTNLSAATINTWKDINLDDSHPNFDNLQLNYTFEGSSSDVIVDASGNGRDGRMIGTRYTVSFNDGLRLFKAFDRVSISPNLTFYQGDYTISTTSLTLDRPVVRTPQHFLTTNTIVPAPAGVLEDDQVVASAPVEIFGIVSDVYDEVTGALVETIDLTPDGDIEIGEVSYFRRFPFYNELVSFVTPYGINLDFGLEGRSWYFDMTDYVSLLKGNKRIQMTLGGQNQEQMDLEFIYTVGTPPRDVVQYEQLWQGTNRIGIAQISQIASNAKFPRMTFDLSPDAETFLVKSSITGHGQEGEFAQSGGVVTHNLALNTGTLSSWQITQECSENPIYPQGGTWVFDRQGWCPGERTHIEEVDFTSDVSPGETVTFDYSTSAPANPAGDYRYHVAHQVIGYGPANFQQDASIVKVIAPNNSAEFTRVGTICANPQVVLRNTGATDLESATIRYWINGSTTPQTFDWTGNLAFMEEEVVFIPSPRALWFDVRSDNNVFYAEVVNPNGGIDMYPNNNLVSSPFDFPEVLPQKLEFRVRTNNVPGENRYVVLNSADEVVFSNGLLGANTTYNDELDLGTDCYRIVFTDTGGDGLSFFANPGQGVGSALLRDDFGNTIMNFTPDFGGGFEFSFSTDFALSAEEIAFLSSIEVYPNPTTDFATLMLESTQDVDIQIVDVLGRAQPVTEIERSGMSIRLDVSSMARGTYFVVVRKDDLHTTRKLEVH
jgi:hypothetical protein